jgi:two-component system, NtrC family, sensor kinase
VNTARQQPTSTGTRVGVGHKLVFLTLTLIIIVSFSFAAVNVMLSRRWIEDDLNESVITFARAIAATIGDRRELESSSVLHDEIRQILAVEPNLLQLDVLTFGATETDGVASSDPQRRPLFSSPDADPVRAGRVISRLVTEPTGRYWEVMAPVAIQGVVLGAVAAKFSLAPAARQEARLRTWAYALTAASVIVTGLLMSQTVRAVVHRPIRRFMKAIAEVRAGHATATVSVATRDEFGVLAQHFNDMMGRLNQFNDELQRRVTEATAELDQRYQQVQHLNEALFEMQRSLGHAERLALSGRIMAEVAHEVGTPLHSIAGHLQLLREDLPVALRSAEAARRLDIIETQVRRVIDIISQLLDLTRRPPGRRDFIDVNRLVRDTTDLVRPGATAAGLRVDVATEPALPKVQGVGNQLQQVVLNLVTNAIDATSSGGRIAVTTRAVAQPHEIEIVVADTGKGISLEDQKRLFEPFFSTKEPGQGTGLGLFISAQIVREHQGRIEVESREGSGSVFRVVLPEISGV